MTGATPGRLPSIPFGRSGHIGLGFDRAWFEDVALRVPVGTSCPTVRSGGSVLEGSGGPGFHQPGVEAGITVR